MAESDHEPDSTVGETGQNSQRNWRQLLLRSKWIAAAAAALLVGACVVAIARSGIGESSPARAEITLGEFEFLAGDAPGVLIQKASFRLHVGLLRQGEEIGRGLLAAHQFKVQQEIEQLLRRAASADFEDPLLADLKRQLQELINETLGSRVVEEVIITDLAVTRSGTSGAMSFDSPTASFNSATTPTSSESRSVAPTDSDLIY